MATITGIPSTITITAFKDSVQVGTPQTIPNPNQHLQVIHKRVNANLTTIQNFINAHPTGAVLTAAQTLIFAKMMVGLCKLLLTLTTTITGT